MYTFDFVRADTLDRASELLQNDDNSRLIAGGMSLLPAMKLRLAQVSTLIDLSAVKGLNGIRLEGSRLVFGAMTRHADVAASALVKEQLPVLAQTASRIGDRQIRNRGTMGGSLANNDPAADYPAAVLALNATIVTNRREIAADDFFIDIYTTALDQGEIIREIAYPCPVAAEYVKFVQPASRFALVGVFVAKLEDSTVRVAVTGAGPSVFRCTELETELTGEFSPEAARRVRISSKDLNSDMHGDADYRAHLIGIMAARAVEACSKNN